MIVQLFYFFAFPCNLFCSSPGYWSGLKWMAFVGQILDFFLHHFGLKKDFKMAEQLLLHLIHIYLGKAQLRI